LSTARAAIRHALLGKHGRFTARTEDPHLREPAASFVTLKLKGQLRGCIGALEASEALLDNVAHNAVAAALRDPRFPPLSLAEFGHCLIEISVLTPMTAMDVQSEEDLLAQLQVNVDGLLIDDGRRRATFLPKVWEQLPSPQEFVEHLKLKAGIEVWEWPASMRCYRYRALEFAEDKRGA
jgi:hypothetical protein